MFTKCLFWLGCFTLSPLCVLILSFGLSFLFVPHQPVNPYKLMEKTRQQGEIITADWWEEVYIPEKHHVRFTILANKRGVVFKRLFIVLIPLVSCSFYIYWRGRSRFSMHQGSS